MKIQLYRNEIISVYNNRLTIIQNIKTNNYTTMFDDEINSLKNMLHFLNTASTKEIIKLPAIIEKFSAKQYISSFELKFIQTKFYNNLKYNSNTHYYHKLLNTSFLFGFVKEIEKGYRTKINGKTLKKNSIYILDKERKNFLNKLLEVGEKYSDIFQDMKDKLFKRSLEHFENTEIIEINPNKKYFNKIWASDKRKEAVDFIKNTNILIYNPARNDTGRLYNKYWNNLSKYDKIGLFPEYDSYDLNAGIYQFLKIYADEKGLKSEKIKHYIDKKEKMRKVFNKRFFNSFIYKIQGSKTLEEIMPYRIKEEDYLYLKDLYTEINEILINMKVKTNKVQKKKYNSLFYMYENWERNIIKEFKEKNNLKDAMYLINHDEILVHKDIKIRYVNKIFGFESHKERQAMLEEYNNMCKEEFIKERDLKIKKENRIADIIHYRGVLKRCKKIAKRIEYFLKIESLKVSYDENLLVKNETLSF